MLRHMKYNLLLDISYLLIDIYLKAGYLFINNISASINRGVVMCPETATTRLVLRGHLQRPQCLPALEAGKLQ